MRNRVLLLTLTSVLMSLCVPMGARQPQTPVQGVIAHIDDSKLFSDSLPPQYRLPEGQTYEDVIRNLPGVEILEDGTITVNGKKVTRILLNGPDIINKEDTTLKRLTAEMIEKVKTYEMTSETQVKKDKTISECYVIEIGAISDQNRARPAYRDEYTNKTYQVPEGITIKELILSLPGIKTNILGRLVAKKRKRLYALLISIVNGYFPKAPPLICIIQIIPSCYYLRRQLKCLSGNIQKTLNSTKELPL